MRPTQMRHEGVFGLVGALFAVLFAVLVKLNMPLFENVIDVAQMIHLETPVLKDVNS